MRKFSIILLVMAMCLSLCACVPSGSDNGGSNAAVGNGQAATVVPTMPMATEPVIEEIAPTTAPAEGGSGTSQGGDNTSAGCNHNFSKATCQQPATCSLCGKTEGTVADHTFNKASCTVCGAANPVYADIAAALKAIERYPKYIEINKDLIANEYDLFKLNGKLTHYNDAHENTLAIHDYLQKVVDKCEDYVEYDFWIKEMVEDCKEHILEMPIVPTSTGNSAIRSYMSKCKTYATQADRIFVQYENLCETYGVK